MYIFAPKTIRRQALSVTRKTPKASYIFASKGHKTAEYYSFCRNTDTGIVIGTKSRPAILHPSKKLYEIDGIKRYYEFHHIEHETILFVRGYPKSVINAFKSEFISALTPKEKVIFYAENGLTHTH